MTTRSYRLLSSACEDLRDAHLYYENQSPGLGNRFLDEFESVLRRIQAHPEAWTPVSQRLRRCMFRVFPYAVLYCIASDELIVSAVMDLRAGPGELQNRLSRI